MFVASFWKWRKFFFSIHHHIRVGLIKLKLLSVTFWQRRGCFIVKYTHLDMKTFLFWFLDSNWQCCNLFSAFLFYKGNLKIYKGKYASRAFWLSFLTYWYNQFNFLTMLPHFYWRFSRHQYDICLSYVICHRWHYWHISDVSDDRWRT